jgi:V/A-type H+/Na+-transporting ATPase subunit I
MRIRPAEAKWFEAYTPRQDTVRAVEAMAATGVVQLEVDPRFANSAETAKLRYFVERFKTMEATVAGDLPGAGDRATTLVGDPVHIANQALHRLRIWLARHDYVSERLEQVRAEHDGYFGPT